MPRAKKGDNSEQSLRQKENHEENDILDTNEQHGRKRAFMEQDDEADCNEEFGVASEMKKMLETFGADISKTLSNKKRRLSQLTNNSVKTQSQKVEALMKGQLMERQKLFEEFDKQLAVVLQQWEADLNKAKEQEEKLLHLFQQQQKLVAQARSVMTQRMKTVVQLREKYAEAVGVLDSSHLDQQSTVQMDLQKEMGLLQKKILMDTQQQEMANMKKNLQTMLF